MAKINHLQEFHVDIRISILKGSHDTSELFNDLGWKASTRTNLGGDIANNYPDSFL